MYVWNHSKFLRVLFSNFYLSVIFTLSPLSTPRIHSLLPSVISCFFVLPFRFFALSTNFALCNALRPSNLAILAPELGPDDSQWTLLSSGIPPPPPISLGTPLSRRSLPQMCLFFFFQQHFLCYAKSYWSSSYIRGEYSNTTSISRDNFSQEIL